MRVYAVPRRYAARSLREIALELGVSYQRVEQIYDSAMTKLRRKPVEMAALLAFHEEMRRIRDRRSPDPEFTEDEE